MNKYSSDYGLLILRVFTGALFMYYGFPKITGGPDMWTKLGGAMSNVHIHFFPAFWGFMAALAEFGGGICMVLGVFFRPALAMMLFTMFIAFLVHYMKGDAFNDYQLIIVFVVIFLCLFLAGPGRFAIKISKR